MSIVIHNDTPAMADSTVPGEWQAGPKPQSERQAWFRDTPAGKWLSRQGVDLGSPMLRVWKGGHFDTQFVAAELPIGFSLGGTPERGATIAGALNEAGTRWAVYHIPEQEGDIVYF